MEKTKGREKEKRLIHYSHEKIEEKSKEKGGELEKLLQQLDIPLSVERLQRR